MTTNGPRWRSGVAGYTLVELAVVVAIVATAAALAYPSTVEMTRGQRLESAAVGLTQQLRLARWRAVVTGSRVRVALRPRSGGGMSFLVEREQGAIWVPDGEELRLPAATLVSVAGPQDKVFNPDGTCGLGSVTLRGAGGGMYRCTLAPATGRVRLYRGEREIGRGV